VGPGGIGKATVAIEIAERLRAGYHDEAYFIDLSTLSDPDFVISAAARAFDCSLPERGCRAARNEVLIHSRCKLVPSSLREAAAAPIKRDEITSILGASAEPQHPVSLAGTSNMDSGTR
jgi:cytidylate kinase